MNVILAPVVTEKTVEDMKKGKYTFKVARSADKLSIKKSLEENFKVNIVNVATINMKEKKRKNMQGKRLRKAPYKKAIVALKEGQKIDIFNIQK